MAWFSLVGAAFLNAVGDVAAVLRRLPFGERGGAVLTPRIRVDQLALGAGEAVADIEDRLVLKPVVAGVEIAASGLLRHAEPLVVVELAHAGAERVAVRQLGEEGVGDVVLLGDPLAHPRVLADVILEPAIGILDRHAELGVDDSLARGLRVGDGLPGRRLSGLRRDRQRRHGNGQGGQAQQDTAHKQDLSRVCCGYGTGV